MVSETVESRRYTRAAADAVPRPAISDRPPAVVAPIAYHARTPFRPRYHANDLTRDLLTLEPHDMTIVDARPAGAELEVEGFKLVAHRSAVSDFRDAAQVAAIHGDEIRELLLDLTGADVVTVGGRAILRFGERDKTSGMLDNSRPARFAHVDMSADTARAFAGRAIAQDPALAGRTVRRFAYYNVWRSFSGAPQDVPLALCDGRSVADGDLLAADAVFDVAGQPDWSFEGWVAAYNPAHRWSYFRDMTPGEVIVFKTAESEAGRVSRVPHVAFDDPSCPEGTQPRASVEMRGTAYWFD
ncbi:MAG: CmcJ/NvfI family oxidoreductase [Janthinobacterium lividum]